ncbi:DUF4255 domain-containing protein [Paracoccus marinaquae]|uniref:DUF4255 domain-containing protein n=1 Tax=Paracoccus marinaquae TaxID=2841926 RepID=A0ABS6AJN7_9RHOB|nr:DUF4255 domain-containing protein [Paracoccus marinaquae]MBU3030112.1 DUF4255 domain-containing protein [Paracoccus marinaquae]
MIDLCLKLIRDQLNRHLQGLFAVPEDMVVLSPLVDATGKQADETRNRVALFLLNLAQDTVPRQRRPGGSPEVGMLPPIHLDIYFMLAAAHDPELYAEGLKQMSAAMLFFQANPVLTPRNVPEMPRPLSQLSIDMINLRVEELAQLWGNLGGRYVPSVTYKMRTAMIDAEAITRIDPVITTRENRALPKGGA